MKKKIINSIQDKLNREFSLEKPKDLSFGHYATPVAFSLAKEFRKSPILIAEELCHQFEECSIFHEVTAVKGYINFKLSESFLDEYASWAIAHEELFAKDEHHETILLEFVSANPTGPLHIGHARGAVIGDALCKIGNHLGYKIDSEYYVNDAGNQIRLLGLSIYLSGREQILKLETTWPEEFYRGEYIQELAVRASEDFSPDIFKDEKNIEILSDWGKEMMLDLIRENLAQVGITFDYFVSEKSLYSKWDASFKRLRDHDKTYEKDGKVWIKSSEHGDEKDRVVVRDDGRPTYLAGDIIYHDNKFQRQYDRYINIWGADHHGYIARVKAAINFLGYDETKLEIILAQMVSLLKGGEPYKMSKRSGNFILMSDVVDEIGKDALRFVFLSKKADTHLEFDVDMLKQQDSTNPIFYINYAHARINQIFEKSGKKVEDILSVKLENLSDDATNLLYSALLLPEVLDDAFTSRQVQRLSDYLKSLAASLHKFYNENRVVGEINEDKYLKIFAMVALSLRVGLRLMGIEAKDKM
ncbi:arginine--tRNA ligase [Sulfurospirillum sp. 1612]|uniref:arginine--tRNA ligase n=1 Tax=Sulfurospirillum sp. 1612 TaxID=3094835 RepID=UPI002F94AF38